MMHLSETVQKLSIENDAKEAEIQDLKTENLHLKEQPMTAEGNWSLFKHV